MTLAFALILGLAAFAVIVFVLKAPRRGREAIGAALLVGLAGYALQGSPGLPGAPHEYRESPLGDPAVIVDLRKEIEGNQGIQGSKWVVIADAMVRHGQFAEAASVLTGAVESDPDDAEAWLALGNALVGHADGNLTPAALYAYRRAAQAAPGKPGAPFFLGLAMAESGRLADARALWAGILARSPADAPWRPAMEVRLQRLDAFIAGQAGAAGRQ